MSQTSLEQQELGQQRLERQEDICSRIRTAAMSIGKFIFMLAVGAPYDYRYDHLISRTRLPDDMVRNLEIKYGKCAVQKTPVSCLRAACAFVVGRSEDEIEDNKYLIPPYPNIEETIDVDQAGMYLNSIGLGYKLRSYMIPLLLPDSIPSRSIIITCIDRYRRCITHSLVYLESCADKDIAFDPWLGTYRYIGEEEHRFEILYPSDAPVDVEAFDSQIVSLYDMHMSNLDYRATHMVEKIKDD